MCLRQLEVELTAAYLSTHNVLRYPIRCFNWLQRTPGARPNSARYSSSYLTNHGLIEEVVTRMVLRQERNWILAFSETIRVLFISSGPARGADCIHHISITRPGPP